MADKELVKMHQTNRLLILDDDPCVAQTIAVVAQREGFNVRTCERTDEFFALVAQWVPTHLALDLVMPGMDGVEVLRLLAEQTCDARILLTSGMGAKVLESAQRSGDERGLHISGILPKPFRAHELRVLLNDASPQQIRCAPVYMAAADRSITEQDLAQAFALREFFLHYQPKVALDTGRPVGFEALVRWRRQDGAIVAPDRFIPLIEQSGQIQALTDYVLDEGLQWFTRLPPVVSQSLKLSINLSARNLNDLKLADRLRSQCVALGVAPTSVILELTESSAMADPAEARDIMTRLRIKGFALGIDDFGTGYSSMVQLARLPFSELKIDKSFVLSMLQSNESRKIVASTIQLGCSLGMTVVAEGIEDAATARMLRELGCTLGQGYHFGRPMDGATASQWLSGKATVLP
jgi:EAL domain-containing protein (putative c-di-GMP-specific phosphodiesterase class I)/ActR/RegA family two-component response regulator